mmetsp:Transcript_38002/g.68750  ORF Transcript_38002/g.68750 Transcript_38002/m.68750 type:complete len:90 (-) Transcript_38002:22-291(-)
MAATQTLYLKKEKNAILFSGNLLTFLAVLKSHHFYNGVGHKSIRDIFLGLLLLLLVMVQPSNHHHHDYITMGVKYAVVNSHNKIIDDRR